MSQEANQRPAVTGRARGLVIFLQKAILLLARHWFILANLLALVILGLGFLAPAFMASGQPETGRAIYRFLAPHNHQLPQRSYFLFSQAGSVQTYPIEQLLTQGANPNSMETFLGNPEIGYKMALNHRMTAIFVGILAGGIAWGLARGRPRLSLIWFLVMTFPLLLDAFSHITSESSGQGFRASNDWAVTLTGGLFPATFYTSATIGSLNWLLRTLTGLVFGLGLAWFLYTYLSTRFMAIRRHLEPKLRKAGAIR